jgi:hypothetical protein
MNEIVITENEQLTRDGIIFLVEQLKTETDKRQREKICNHVIEGLRILWGGC